MSIVSDYEKGFTIPEIMARYGVSRDTVYRKLKDAGVPNRKQRVTDKNINDVCKRYYKRETIVNIARALGLTKQRVHYIITTYFDRWKKGMGSVKR